MTRMYFESPNLRGQEQDGQGRELGEKGTESIIIIIIHCQLYNEK